MSFPELLQRFETLEGVFLSSVAGVHNHLKLPEIASKRTRNAFERERSAWSHLFADRSLSAHGSHHIVTALKWFDLHCASVFVLICSKMCEYNIFSASLSNALHPFFNDGINEYRRCVHRILVLLYSLKKFKFTEFNIIRKQS